MPGMEYAIWNADTASLQRCENGHYIDVFMNIIRTGTT